MEASPEQSAEGLAIVQVLAAVLDRLVFANAPIARADPGQVTKFHAMKAPGIAIQQYLERIHKYASCSNECFILALIYIDRLIQRNNFLLTDLNVHRVVITGVLLAAKFFDDAYYNNAYYAKVGGVLVSEINGLEVDFLFRINFSLHVTPDEFDKYRAELLSHSITSAAPTSVESFHVPAQVSPEVHSAAAVMDTDAMSIVMCQNQLINNSAAVAAAALLVTPSPPSAAQISEVLRNAAMQKNFFSQQECGFPPMHRSNSMPPLHKPPTTSPVYQEYHRIQPASVPAHHHHPPRCVQQQFPISSNDPYNNIVVMDNRQIIYPSQATLVHHHHGTFAQNPAVDSNGCGMVAPRDGSQTLAQGPMLTGMSGVGL